MTLIFNSNSFKYEIEAVVKLFLPAQSFNFVFDDREYKIGCIDDYCEISLDEDADKYKVSVEAMYNELGVDRSAEILKSSDDNEKNLKQCELEAARMLFECLAEIFEEESEWGILTGVRPVKRVNELLDKGYDYPKIYAELHQKFFVSPKRIDIAYKTAISQIDALSRLESNSFSLYISIPFCPTRCSYCSFISQEADKNNKLMGEYVQKLCKEIRYTGRKASEYGLRLDTIYIGGGTPTTLEPVYLDTIMKTIAESFDTSFLSEYTVEAGRPDTITEEKLRVIKENGAQRISINPQTLNDDVLVSIGRKHTVEQFYKAFEIARKVGFKCINTDIIAGLTSDTVDSFKNTLDEIIKLSPENVTAHTLSIKRAANLVNKSDEVINNPAKEMVEYSLKVLSENEYLPYYLYKQKNMLDNLENIGWTKEGYEGLYNIYIMEEVQNIIALGSGASSKVVTDDDIHRVFNFKLPLEYINNFDKMLAKKDEIFELIGNRNNEEK